MCVCLCVCYSTEGQEVKVGEYNAIADVLDLINNSIRFQGKRTTAYVCVRLRFCASCVRSDAVVKTTEEEKGLLMHPRECLYIR